MADAARPQRVVMTGAGGFVGKNLMLRLSELAGFEAVPLVRGASEAEWDEAIGAADAVIHLAGVNRPQDEADLDTQITVTPLAASASAMALPMPRPAPVTRAVRLVKVM